MGEQEALLPDLPPGRWRVLSGQGRAAIEAEERATGLRTHQELSHCAFIMKPSMFEGEDAHRIWLLPNCGCPSGSGAAGPQPRLRPLRQRGRAPAKVRCATGEWEACRVRAPGNVGLLPATCICIEQVRRSWDGLLMSLPLPNRPLHPPVSPSRRLLRSSRECQCLHWKKGGHRERCAELAAAVAAATSAAGGGEGTAGGGEEASGAAAAGRDSEEGGTAASSEGEGGDVETPEPGSTCVSS